MAVRFDASGEHYSSSNPATGSLHTFTFWAKIQGGAAQQGLMGYSASTGFGVTGSVGVIRTSAGVAAVDVANVGSTSSGVTLANDTWYCFAFVRTSATAGTFYVGTDPNNLTAVAVSLTSATTAPVVLTIGAWTYSSAGNGSFLIGSIAAFQQYSVALTADEIARELSRYKPYRRDNLVRWHPFLGTDTADWSGAGNTLSGGVGAATEDGPPVRWGRTRSLRVDAAGPAVISPLSVPTAESVGTPSLRQIVRPLSIPTAESVGTPRLRQVVRPATVPSPAAVGTPTVVRLGTIVAVSVPSPTAVGVPTVRPGTVTIRPTSVSSAESIGMPVITIVLDISAVPPRAGSRRRTPKYELLAMAFIPAPSGPPTLIDVDAVKWSQLTWSETLSRRQELTATCAEQSLTLPVQQRLDAPDLIPTEMWLLRNGAQVFAGPLLGAEQRGRDVVISAGGLLTYLETMIVEASKRFDQVDQFAIAAWLIDQWQALEFGHFGIDTSQVGTSGKLRDRSFERDEIHWVDRRLQELGAVRDGFDFEIDPTTRALQLWHPGKGVDRSTGETAVIFDRRSAGARDAVLSVAPGDLASEAYGLGTSAGGDQTLWSHQPNLDLRAAIGRRAVASSWSDVSEQSTLDDHVAALRDSRARALRAPGRRVRVTPDTDLTAYGVGDTVRYQTGGAVRIDGAFRIRSRTVTVDPAGQEVVDLEFV